MRSHSPFLLAVFLVAFASLGAQNNAPPASSPPQNGKARILGVVIDSVNLIPLPGADIMLEGARASTVSDSLGKFEFDSLPPGTFTRSELTQAADTASPQVRLARAECELQSGNRAAALALRDRAMSSLDFAIFGSANVRERVRLAQLK